MPVAPRAICVPCGREYLAGPGKTGAWAEVKLRSGCPYYKVMGDIWVCPGCGHQIMRGFSNIVIEPHDDLYIMIKEVDVDVVV